MMLFCTSVTVVVMRDGRVLPRLQIYPAGPGIKLAAFLQARFLKGHCCSTYSTIILHDTASLTTIHFPLFFLFQEIKHFKQMRGNEAGAAEIKTQGECWKETPRNSNTAGLSHRRSRSRGGRHTVKSSH